MAVLVIYLSVYSEVYEQNSHSQVKVFNHVFLKFSLSFLPQCAANADNCVEELVVMPCMWAGFSAPYSGEGKFILCKTHSGWNPGEC